jgi:hypothetical protein
LSLKDYEVAVGVGLIDAVVLQKRRNTIDLWLNRREVTGEFKAKNSYQKGSRHKNITGISFDVCFS